MPTKSLTGIPQTPHRQIQAPAPSSPPWNSTKAAVRSFARTWTSDLKERKIRVNALSPGTIDTPILDGLGSTKEEVDKAKAGFASLIPLGRMGEPDEIAKVALFLASDDSSFVTGVELFVDGGMAQI